MTTQDDLPKAVWEGSFIVGGVEVKCVVLDDGRRIIEAESMEALVTDFCGFDVGLKALMQWCVGGASK